MQSQPYVEVVKVAVYEYATSKCARDAPSRAGGASIEVVHTLHAATTGQSMLCLLCLGSV